MTYTSKCTAIWTAIFALAIVLPPARPRAQTPTSGPVAGQPAPNFAVKDSTGRLVRLSTLRGRVVLLDFWATWCTGCKLEIPWYVEFQKKHGAEGLTSVGVAMDEDGWTSVRPYLREHPISYRIVINERGIGDQYGVTNLPVTLLIDRQGKIADAHLGLVDNADWEKKIQALLRTRASRSSATLP
jgi:cytochrome c biogenesis protein CcmG/thiol:disulfide interchange protein DsbE